MADEARIEAGDERPSTAAPGYHRALADHLRRTEPELWDWFSESSSLAERRDDEAEVALLTSAYRLDGGIHDVLTAHASLLAERFGIDDEIVLYQQLGDTDRNARVFRLNGRIHVVFSGDLLDLLDGDEPLAVLAHELAHIVLWTIDDGTYYVLDHLVHRLASEPTAADAVVETARRLRLHTEVWADALATDAAGDIAAVVGSIVKVNAGIRHVDPTAYLRQAAEILELDGGASRAWTHPELHIRVACIEARNRGTSDEMVQRLVDGPDDLDRLDLLGQLRLCDVTARVLSSGAAVVTDHEAVDVHLRTFGELTRRNVAPLGDGALAEHEPSVRWYGASLLVDLALCDLALGDGASDGIDDLRALAREAQRLGAAEEFDKILGRATDRTPAQVAQIRGAAS